MTKILFAFNLPRILGGGIFAAGYKIDWSLARHALWHLIMTAVSWWVAGAALAMAASLTWAVAMEISQGAQHGWNENNIFDILEIIIAAAATFGVIWLL